MLQLASLFFLLPVVSGALLNDWRNKTIENDISPDYCVFPFKYKGGIYNSCTSVDSKYYRLWCSLTSDYDEDKLWGHCLGSHSGPSTVVSPCTFPFVYRGVMYSGCTTAHWFPGLSWCSISANFDEDKDKKWAYCPSSGVRVSSMLS